MKLNTLVLFALMALTMTITSCGEDPIRGCTDAAAESFDPTATEEDNSCVYTRDKFLGDYLADLDCAGILQLINTEGFALTISESLSEDVNEVTVSLGNLGIDLKGIVSGNAINLSAMVENFPYDPDGDGVPNFFANLTVGGGAVLDEAGEILDGALTVGVVAVDTGVMIDTDTCAILGVKQ